MGSNLEHHGQTTFNVENCLMSAIFYLCLMKKKNMWAWSWVWNDHGQATLGAKNCLTNARKKTIIKLKIKHGVKFGIATKKLIFGAKNNSMCGPKFFLKNIWTWIWVQNNHSRVTFGVESGSGGARKKLKNWAWA
jgi:hypothetical protein